MILWEKVSCYNEVLDYLDSVEEIYYEKNIRYRSEIFINQEHYIIKIMIYGGLQRDKQE